MPYSFVADSFHTMKLCSRLDSSFPLATWCQHQYKYHLLIYCVQNVHRNGVVV